MKARFYNLCIWVGSFGVLVSLWFMFCQLQAYATTPIGSSKELLPWTQGRADCPFVVSRGGQVVGEVYCDGGGSGAFAPATGQNPPCPFTVRLVDGGVVFNADCDSSINYNTYPATNNFTVDPTGNITFDRFLSGQTFPGFPDGGIGIALLTNRDLALTPAYPALRLSLSQNNIAHSSYWAFDGAQWVANRAVDITVGGVEGGVYFKNGGLWLGTKTNHDLFLGTNDGFGFMQGNASGVSFYAPITMGNRQINSLGVATAATDAAVRNQAIETKDPASGSQLPIKARGHQALSSGAGTHTFATAFATAPECTCSTEVADPALACSATSTVITLAGTGSNVVHWNCDGNL